MSARCVAAIVEQFGDASRLRLREQPMPQAGPGQILVQVAAASINPIDVRRRAGYGHKLLGLMGAGRLPLVLGNDFAGNVCAVGPGVTGWREGDAVFGAKPPSRHGTHASHVAVNAAHVLAQPAGIDPAQAATLPYNFFTVCRALSDAGITRTSVMNQKVLVHGGSGGLGMIAIPLLKQLGAHVTSLSSEHALAACAIAGANVVLDRQRHRLASLSQQFVATLNFAHWSHDAELLERLAPGAVGHATTVHPMMEQIDRYGVVRGALAALYRKRRSAAGAPRGARYAWTMFRSDSNALTRLAEHALALPVAPAPLRFSLEDVIAAHQHVEQRQLGRVVLLPMSF